MIIIIGVLSFFVISLVGKILALDSYYDGGIDWEDMWTGLLVISSIFLLAMLMFFSVMRFGSTTIAEEAEALQITYDNAREQLSDFEVFEITRDISEFNTGLARQKHWRQSPWTSWFISPNVLDAEFVR